MSPNAAAFLPAWLQRALAANDCDPLPRSFVYDGAAMFIDLAGFTRITEQFANAGPEGAESLRTLLDAHFGGIIEGVEHWGGEVAAFAGDAILVAFFAERHGSPLAAVRAAVACAREVHKRQPAPGAPTLAHRISIAAGTLVGHALVAADATGVSVLGGEAVARLAVPHSQGQPGETMLDAVAIRLNPLPGDDRDGGSRCVYGPANLKFSESTAPTKPLPPSVSDAALLARWLPRVVAERMEAGQGEWVSEFRTATVLFTGLGARQGDADDVAALQTEVQRLTATLARFEGDCLGVVIDEKGATLIGAFGLPGRAHDDDAARAILAAIEIQRGGHVSVGIATGRLYVGVLGSAIRRDYGGLGPTMNLAARLMGKANGGVLLDAATARAAGDRVAVESAGTLSLKGWAEPVAVLRPGGLARRAARRKMVGRGAILDRLHAQLRAEPAGLRIHVMGEPGVGKSSVLDAMVAHAEAAGTTVLSGEANAIERGTPWHAWRGVLAALVKGETAESVVTTLASDELAAWAPVLNGIWPLQLPETELTRQLESGARAAALTRVVHRLCELASNKPCLLLFDDVHWFDTASAALLRDVLRRTPTIGLVIAGRNFDEAVPAEVASVVNDLSLEPILLGMLGDDELERLVANTLGVSHAPDELVELVRLRGGGHPFYSEQIVLALIDDGGVVCEGDQCRLAGERTTHTFPASIEGVVTARIDRLSTGAQLTVKVASVVGRTFAERAVQQVYPVEGASVGLSAWLSQLGRHHLIGPEPNPAEPTWSFQHAITQEVAYGLLLFSQRRELHRRVARWYGSVRAGDEPWPVLAYHHERAGEVEQALSSLERAGAAALRSAANVEAIQFVERAKSLAAQEKIGIAGEQGARLATLLGVAHLKLVHFDLARAEFRAALGHLGRPVPAGVFGVLADLTLASARQLRHLVFGPRQPSLPAERSHHRAAAEAHQGLAEVAYFTLDLAGLLHANVHAVNHAERAGEPRELAAAWGSAAIAAGVGGLHPLARRWSRQSLEAAEQSGHLPTVAYTNLLAAVYTNSVGDWARAAQQNARATSFFVRLGDRFRTATSLCGEAFNRLACAKPTEAARFIAEARRATPEEGGLQPRVWCAATDILLHLSADESCEAETGELTQLLAQNPHHAERIMALGVLSAANARAGRLREGVAQARQMLELARQSPPSNWFQLWSLQLGAETLIAGAKAGVQPWSEAKSALRVLLIFSWMIPSAKPAYLAAKGAMAGARSGALPIERPTRPTWAWTLPIAKRANP